eukprot:1360267-Amorphochlora_amoeboformis.AAC.1
MYRTNIASEIIDTVWRPKRGVSGRSIGDRSWVVTNIKLPPLSLHPKWWLESCIPLFVKPERYPSVGENYLVVERKDGEQAKALLPFLALSPSPVLVEAVEAVAGVHRVLVALHGHENGQRGAILVPERPGGLPKFQATFRRFSREHRSQSTVSAQQTPR